MMGVRHRMVCDLDVLHTVPNQTKVSAISNKASAEPRAASCIRPCATRTRKLTLELAEIYHRMLRTGTG